MADPNVLTLEDVEEIQRIWFEFKTAESHAGLHGAGRAAQDAYVGAQDRVHGRLYFTLPKVLDALRAYYRLRVTALEESAMRLRLTLTVLELHLAGATDDARIRLLEEKLWAAAEKLQYLFEALDEEHALDKYDIRDEPKFIAECRALAGPTP